MSYDLAVYTTRAVSADELGDLVAHSDVLAIETTVALSLTVVRGSRRRYSFTVDGPDPVEIEDIPSEVAAVMLGARYLYSVAVEGSAETEIPHAVRFARRLAEATNGAVYDQQADEVWTRSQSRKVHKPARKERVATIDVAWYCLGDDLAHNAAALFIDAARRTLPEALPRRFGEYEPLQGKLVDDGVAGFIRAWSAATSMLFITGSGPCVGGHLSAGQTAQLAGRFWSMSLKFLADPFQDPAWRESLRVLFVRLADELPAFYASAEVTAGHIWSGRSLWSDGDTEWSINPVRYGKGWTGLPPVPTWWSWLGEPFAAYWSRLPEECSTPTKAGILYRAAEEPRGPSGLVPLSASLPGDLFATLAPNPRRQHPVPITPAATIPEALLPSHT